MSVITVLVLIALVGAIVYFLCSLPSTLDELPEGNDKRTRGEQPGRISLGHYLRAERTATEKSVRSFRSDTTAH